jgi:uncharacterized repeat protein (TIGR01451 family)
MKTIHDPRRSPRPRRRSFASFFALLLAFSFTLGQAGTLIAFADDGAPDEVTVAADDATAEVSATDDGTDAAAPAEEPSGTDPGGDAASSDEDEGQVEAAASTGGGGTRSTKEASVAAANDEVTAQALSAGGVSLDFLAAGPYTYDHATGIGGIFGNRTISKSNGVVESLEGGDFACGDLVVFFTGIAVDAGAGSGSIDLDFRYDGQTTSGAPVGFNDLVSASISANPPDFGNTGNGNETVQVLDEEFKTNGNRRLETSLRIGGLDGGEHVVLRMVVRLYCDPADKITGNIHSQITGARVTGGQRINVGNQTVPLKQAGNILVPGLNVAKSCPATATVGEAITYEITVTNSGQDTLNNLVVNDPLLGGNLAGFPSSLTAGQVVTASFPYTVGASPDPLTNTVTATASAQTSTATLTDSADCTVDVLFPDLDVTKTANPAGPVSAGQQIGFDIEVTNDGEGAAFGVTLTDTLPTIGGLTWSIQGTSGGWSCAIASGVLTCGGSSFDLSAGASASVRIVSPTSAASCAVITNTAVVGADNHASVQDSASVTVRCPDLRITKTADADEVNAGDELGYRIRVTNEGPGTATNVTMIDSLPTNAGLAWSVEGTTGGWTCAINLGVLTCGGQGFDLASGASASVHIVSPTTSATCGLVRNAATVRAGNNPTIETGIVEIQVDCADIDLEKTADDATVDAAEQIGFTITATNDGAGVARNVTMTDTLPTDESLSWSIEDTSGGWSCAIAGGVLTCGGQGFDLASGASASVHIVSPTDHRACGTVDNVAEVTTTNDGSDIDDASIVVNCPDLGISIDKSGPRLAHVGDTVTYRLQVSLTTPEPLFDVVVADPLCDAAPVLVAKDGGNQDDVLEHGEVWTYECTHVVTDEDPDPLPNTATVEGTADDGRTTTDEDSHLVDLIHPAISIDKTVNPESGNPGDMVTYTYEVTNTGDTPLYDVTVDDDILGHIGTIPVLGVGETVALTKDYVLPADEIEVVNVAIAAGEDEIGGQVSAEDDASVTIVLVESPTPPPSSPPTAFTGSDAGRFGVLAGLLLVLGMAAAAVGRRRSEEA